MAAEALIEMQQDMEAFLKVAKYPLVKYTDMSAEMKEEAMDVAITAVEKYPGDLEKCTELIKQTMDKKFGAPWHVVAGKGFAYSCTYEMKHFLYIFVGGQTGVLLWKM